MRSFHQEGTIAVPTCRGYDRVHRKFVNKSLTFKVAHKQSGELPTYELGLLAVTKSWIWFQDYSPCRSRGVLSANRRLSKRLARAIFPWTRFLLAWREKEHHLFISMKKPVPTAHEQGPGELSILWRLDGRERFHGQRQSTGSESSDSGLDEKVFHKSLFCGSKSEIIASVVAVQSTIYLFRCSEKCTIALSLSITTLLPGRGLSFTAEATSSIDSNDLSETA
jgi:hypothetical protein